MQDKVIIAHRGASGYLPEHTLPAYTLGYALGAHYLEPDLVMTGDGALICRHDIQLDGTTDAASRFPERARADGHWYAADFSLAEIKTLQAQERLPGRFRRDSRGFQVATFEELIELVAGLNLAFGREVGLMPELKMPAWHRDQGLLLEEAFMGVAARYDLGAGSPMVVQCFEAEPLRRLGRAGCPGSRLRLVDIASGDDGLLTADGLAGIAGYADALGLPKARIESLEGKATGGRELVSAARGRGLAVHVYTFRADDLPPAHPDLAAELRRYLFDYDVDGVFVDHPDYAQRVLGERP